MDLVLVDDHPAVRTGLRGLLEDDDRLHVAATAGTAREGFEAIADIRPALVVADLHLPDDDGLSLCLRTRTLPQAPAVVVYTAFPDSGLAVRAVIAGAAAVVAKSTSPRRLLAVLRAAGTGHLRPTLDPGALRAAGERLDPEDLPVLGMLAHGVPAGEIAGTLGVEPEWLLARRWAMLRGLAPNARRRARAAA
jgi:DNA-binding NarL/FixJ family response regulator